MGQCVKHHAGDGPSILGSEPVCKLCNSNFASQCMITGCAACVLDVASDMRPKSINDLCTRLRLQDHLVRKLELVHLGVVGLHPDDLKRLHTFYNHPVCWFVVVYNIIF